MIWDDHSELEESGESTVGQDSVVWARLGPEALAPAWPEGAQCCGLTRTVTCHLWF